jgi:type IV secretory pathway VirB2 component (pilin)
MKRSTEFKIFTAILTAGAPLLLSGLAFAADPGGVGQINNFVKNMIQILTGIATLIAVAFIVIGGLHYITSSGNPEHLDRAKRTIIYASIGLVITIAAFAITGTVGDSATKAFGN